MQRNIGAFLHAASAAPVTDVTAGGAGDATEVDGTDYDRLVQGSGGPSLSATLLMHFTAVLAAAATLSLAANVQDADDDGAGAPDTYADYGSALVNAVVATGPGGGGTVNGVARLNVNLSGARQWIRAQFTPNLSAANTDTARVSAVWIFGGSTEYPMSDG